jgi:UDP-glucose 4-epimerase
MRILVTGGAGYIGSACVEALIKAGNTVVVYDDFSTGQPEKVSKEAFLVAGSINDLHALDILCSQHRFDAVLHFAAKKAVGESENNPALYFGTNVCGSSNLLQIMDKYSIPKIVFSSTAAVYEPQLDNSLFTEETKTAPISVYGTTKLMVEDMIRAFARTGKLKQYSILRYFNVAGDAGLDFMEINAQNVFPVIARTVNNDGKFTVLGTDYETSDGTCVRDYIHLKDLVEAHLLALKSDTSGTYNLGTGEGYSVRQLVEAFNSLLKKPLVTEDCPRRPGDTAVVVADSSLARNVLGWKPKHNLTEMVEDTLRVYGK